MSTTANYRDYNADNPEFGEFSIDTSGKHTLYGEPVALITQTWMDPASDDSDGGEHSLTAHFTRGQARDLGRALLGWTGDHAFMLYAQHTFEGMSVDGLSIEVVDGEPTLNVGNGPDFIANADICHDMGIRLIVWAGVNTEATING
ncbi:hypothetical protein [Mycolicibacterium sp.]|uniref:hypothetical protein n=1 Tax=Mycolicibacterium sp. TaxID=2320850 RepID=UPI00355D2E71